MLALRLRTAPEHSLDQRLDHRLGLVLERRLQLPDDVPENVLRHFQRDGRDEHNGGGGIHPEPEHFVRFRATRCASPRVVVGVGHWPEERPFLRCGVVHGDPRECLDDGPLVRLWLRPAPSAAAEFSIPWPAIAIPPPWLR